jgi:hypothetical protein
LVWGQKALHLDLFRMLQSKGKPSKNNKNIYKPILRMIMKFGNLLSPTFNFAVGSRRNQRPCRRRNLGEEIRMLQIRLLFLDHFSDIEIWLVNFYRDPVA